LGHEPSGTDRGARNQATMTIVHEFDNYQITEAALNDPSFRDELIALGLDPDTGKGSGTLSSLEFDFFRNTTSQPLMPARIAAVS